MGVNVASDKSECVKGDYTKSPYDTTVPDLTREEYSIANGFCDDKEYHMFCRDCESANIDPTMYNWKDVRDRYIMALLGMGMGANLKETIRVIGDKELAKEMWFSYHMGALTNMVEEEISESKRYYMLWCCSRVLVGLPYGEREWTNHFKDTFVPARKQLASVIHRNPSAVKKRVLDMYTASEELYCQVVSLAIKSK